MRSSRREAKSPPFVFLEWAVLNSEPYKLMRFSARTLLPYFLGKARYQYKAPDIYNKNFSISYKEAKRYGYQSSTYYDAVSQLRKYGFVDKVRQGGSHGDYKATNLYRLSERWKQFGTDKFISSDQDALNAYTQKLVVDG